jgi:hypothetical protein
MYHCYVYAAAYSDTNTNTNTTTTTTTAAPPHRQEMEEYKAKRLRGTIEDPMEHLMREGNVGDDGLLVLPRKPPSQP